MFPRLFLPLVLLALPTSALAQDREKPVLRVYGVGGLVPRAPGLEQPLDEFDDTLVGPLTAHQVGIAEHFGWGFKLKQIVASVTEIVKGFGDGIQVQSEGEQLLVRATSSQHERIARALEMLHQHCGNTFEIEVRHLSVDPDTVNPKLRELFMRGFDDGVDTKLVASLRELDRNGGARGGALRAVQGRWTTFRSLRKERYVPDFDVEIAQGSAIADPIVLPATEGVKAAVLPCLLQDGRAVLRIVASAGTLEKPYRRFRVGTTDMGWINRPTNTGGELEQADFHGCAVSTEALLAPGGRTAVAVCSPIGWEVLLLTLRSAPAPAAAGTFTVLPTGFLSASEGARFLSFHSEGTPDFRLREVEDMVSGRLALQRIEPILREDLPRGGGGFLYTTSWLHHDIIVARSDVATAKRLKARMAALEAEYLRPLRMLVRLESAPPAGERSRVGVLSAALLTDRAASFGAYHRVDYVGDYEVEVAQEARIADPVHRVAYAGLFANLRAWWTGSRIYRVRLDLRVSSFPEGIRVVNNGMAEFGPLQSVPVRTRHRAASLDLAKGESKDLDLGVDPFDPDARLIAVVKIAD